jgi:hypothetical protein
VPAQQGMLSMLKSPPLVSENSAVRLILAAIDMMTILTKLRRGYVQSCGSSAASSAFGAEIASFSF